MPGDSTLLTIKVRDRTHRAAAIANELSNQLIAASPAIRGREADLQESIDRDLAATQDLIEATQTRVQTLTAIENRTAAQSAELLALDARLITLRATFASRPPLASSSESTCSPWWNPRNSDASGRAVDVARHAGAPRPSACSW